MTNHQGRKAASRWIVRLAVVVLVLAGLWALADRPSGRSAHESAGVARDDAGHTSPATAMPAPTVPPADQRAARAVGPAAQNPPPGALPPTGLARREIVTPISAAPGEGSFARFVMRGRRASAAFTDSGVHITLPARGSTMVWGLRWGVAGARAVEPRPEGELPGRVNYFLGSDPAAWKTNQPAYSRVAYDEVLPGVNLRFESVPNGLEYTLVVAPGTSARSIRLSYEGAQQIRIVDDGLALEIETGLGTLREENLVCYQDLPGGRREVAARYGAARGDIAGCAYTIELGEYDEARAVVIDPVITWGSFLGGTSDSGDEYGRGIAVDGSGNVYVAGDTTSIEFPVVGGFDATVENAGRDAFVTKVNAAGSSLAWSSYLGGSSTDYAYDVAVDGSGNAYVVGETFSNNFPSAGGFDATYGGGGYSDAFVAKVNAAGSSLAWSSYLGGGGSTWDQAYAVAVDGAGNVYVAGHTTSADFPSAGGFDATLGGGEDAFVTKVNAAGSSLAWSSYLGGSGAEYAYGIALDGAGNAYLTGHTSASDFPVPGGFDTTLNGGQDAFVTKVNAAGSSLAWSSFLGGSSFYDWGREIAVDGSGNAYVTGYTGSTDFPVPGGFDTTNEGFGSKYDAYVTKVDSAGASLVWSSFLGGAGDENSYGIAVDSSGNVYVAGATNAADFPSAGGFDATYGGAWDAIVTKVNAAGPSLAWSSYLGGPGEDSVEDLAIDGSGNVYVTGQTGSGNFPSSGGFDSTLGGTWDAFVTKVNAAGSSLAWSSYLGGFLGSGPGNESEVWYEDIAVDSAGDVYLTGTTTSVDFPLLGPFDAAFTQGTTGFAAKDAFVTKISGAGPVIAWSSYLGGSEEERSGGVAVDGSGNVYLTGETRSADFPVVAPFDDTKGSYSDVYVTKVSAAGSSLVWSSFLGAGGVEGGRDITVDSWGNVYVTGYTFSSSFPTPGGFDTTLGASSYDTFVTKVNAAGTSLAWSSYLGGSVQDQGYGIAVDGSGNVYVTGLTESGDFPVLGGFDPTLGGTQDAFVTKVNTAGSSLAWSSYLGGDEVAFEYGEEIAVDGSGNVYVTGFTEAVDFPVLGGFDPTLGGTQDAFVTKVNAAGSSLAWSSYLGGAGGEYSHGIAVDSSGNVYVAGDTNAADFPTAGGFDTTFGGEWDAFVTKVNAAGSSLTWSTYLGGANSDLGTGIAVVFPMIYVTGYTSSGDFPVPNGWDTVLGGTTDAFVVRIGDFAPDGTPPIAGTVNDGTGADVDLQVSLTTINANWSGFSDPDSGIAGYAWAIGTTPGGVDMQPFTSVGLWTSASNGALSLTNGATYHVTVRATNWSSLTAQATSDGVTVDVTVPEIGLTPTLFSFSATVGAPNPAQQTLTVANAGLGAFSFTVSPNVAWVTVSPSTGGPLSGGASSAISLGVDTSALTAGIHNATVTVSAPGAANTPQTVSVTLVLTMPNAPTAGSVVPSRALLSSEATYTISGMNFTAGTASITDLRLAHAGAADILPVTFSVISDTRIDATFRFDVETSGGWWTLELTRSDGAIGRLDLALQVLPLRLSLFQPGQVVPRAAAPVRAEFTGVRLDSNLATDLGLTLVAGAESIPLAISEAGLGWISGTISPGTAPYGAYDLQVAFAGVAARYPGVVTLLPFKLDDSGISPPAPAGAYLGQGAESVAIFGEFAVPASEVLVELRRPTDGVTLRATGVRDGCTACGVDLALGIIADFGWDPADRSLMGTYDLVVSQGAFRETIPQAFGMSSLKVEATLPRLIPNDFDWGTAGEDVVLVRGMGFQPGAAVRLVWQSDPWGTSTPGATRGFVAEVEDSTSLRFRKREKIAPGFYVLEVENPDGSVGRLPNVQVGKYEVDLVPFVAPIRPGGWHWDRFIVVRNTGDFPTPEMPFRVENLLNYRIEGNLATSVPPLDPGREVWISVPLRALLVNEMVPGTELGPGEWMGGFDVYISRSYAHTVQEGDAAFDGMKRVAEDIRRLGETAGPGQKPSGDRARALGADAIRHLIGSMCEGTDYMAKIKHAIEEISEQEGCGDESAEEQAKKWEELAKELQWEIQASQTLFADAALATQYWFQGTAQILNGMSELSGPNEGQGHYDIMYGTLTIDMGRAIFTTHDPCLTAMISLQRASLPRPKPKRRDPGGDGSAPCCVPTSAPPGAGSCDPPVPNPPSGGGGGGGPGGGPPQTTPPSKPAPDASARANPSTGADPNDLLVADRSGFIPAAERIRYMARFENNPEAPLPALVVEVTDTLDPTVFDLDSLTFDQTSHPDVVTSQSLDAATGRLLWRFDQINLQPGEGGFVAFSVLPRPGLPSGTELRNRAVITFDPEEGTPSISTNEVNTILDTEAPRLTEAVCLSRSGGILTFRIGASDAASPDAVVYLMGRTDRSHSFLPLVTQTVAWSEAVYVASTASGEAEFVVIAEDRAGNRSAPMAAADATPAAQGSGGGGASFCGASLGGGPLAALGLLLATLVMVRPARR